MNVIVVGGGMAGWMTALWLEKLYPLYNINLIESSKIKTIGVGEGSTPHFLEFLKKVKINPDDFISKTNSTIKLGINFDKWDKDQKNYYHDFSILGDTTSYALHFDSKMALDYLSNVGKNRNINHIIEEVDKEKLKEYDFIFDCTGLHRSILKQNWVDCQEYLPFNSAIPFTLPPLDKNRTQSIATDKGWVWQIPLVNRMGCGYVYNNNKHTEKEIVNDIINHFPEADITRTSISFNPGYQREVWQDNCIAIGLSSSFFEPIEATSLMTVFLQLDYLPNSLDNKFKNTYNDLIYSFNEQVMLFIRYHYVNDREDGIWEWVNSLPLPFKLDLLLKDKKLNVFNNRNFKNTLEIENINKLFTLEQYTLISQGNFQSPPKSLI